MSLAQEECNPPQYSFGAGYLKIKFKRSVFVAKDSKGNGTAFSIDSENGLFLTARHVFEDTASAVIFNPLINNGKRYRVRIIYEDEQKDYCLIRINDLDDFRRYRKFITDFDISLNHPRGGNIFFSLSFPDARSTDLTVLESKVIRSIERENYVEMQTTARPGMSGSPLIDEKGYVVGFAKAQHSDATSGYFRTFYLTDKMYSFLKVSEKSILFLKSLVEGPVDMNDFFYALDPDPFKMHVRNIDIIGLFNRSKTGMPLRYDSVIIPYLECVRTSLVDRGLGKLNLTLALSNSNVPTSQEFINLGLKAFEKKRFKTAAIFLDLAENRTRSRIADVIGSNSDDIDEAFENLNETSLTALFQQNGNNGKLASALLLNDIAYINLLRSDIDKSYSTEVAKLAKLSTKLTNNPLVVLQANELFVIGYKLTGDKRNARTAEKWLEKTYVNDRAEIANLAYKIPTEINYAKFSPNYIQITLH
jgi:Trypsin-like peptidase domain